MARITLAEAMHRPRTVDRAKLDATTEADIRRHQIEDGFDPDEGSPEPKPPATSGHTEEHDARTNRDCAPGIDHD